MNNTFLNSEIDLQSIRDSYEKIIHDYLQKEYGFFHDSRPDAWKDERVGILRAGLVERAQIYQDSLKSDQVFEAYKKQRISALKNQKESNSALTNNELAVLTESRSFAQYAQKTGQYPAVEKQGSISNASDDKKQVNWTIDQIQAVEKNAYNAMASLRYYLNSNAIPPLSADSKTDRKKEAETVLLAYLKQKMSDKPEHAFVKTVQIKVAEFKGQREAYSDLLNTVQKSDKWEEIKQFQAQRATDEGNRVLSLAWQQGDISAVNNLMTKPRNYGGILGSEKAKELLGQVKLADDMQNQYGIAYNALVEYKQYVANTQTQTVQKESIISKTQQVNTGMARTDTSILPTKVANMAVSSFNEYNFDNEMVYVDNLTTRFQKRVSNDAIRARSEFGGSIASYAVADVMIGGAIILSTSATAATFGAAAPAGVVVIGGTMALGYTMDDSFSKEGKKIGNSLGNLLNTKAEKESAQNIAALAKKAKTFQERSEKEQLNGSKQEALTLAINRLEYQQEQLKGQILSDYEIGQLEKQKQVLIGVRDGGKTFLAASIEQGFTSELPRPIQGEKEVDANGVTRWKHMDAFLADAERVAYLNVAEQEIEYRALKAVVQDYEKAQKLGYRSTVKEQKKETASLVSQSKNENTPISNASQQTSDTKKVKSGTLAQNAHTVSDVFDGQPTAATTHPQRNEK